MKIKITDAVLLAALLVAAPALAQDPAQTPAATEARKAEEKQDAATKEEVRTLAEELRRLKLEIGLRDVEYQSYGGMGPAASKVYYAPKGLSIGGYGEVFYRNNLGKTGSDVCATSTAGCDFSDIQRVVLYTGYRFNEKIVFNSEVEFEHQRQIFVEFAYLDFLLSDAIRIRVGNVLVPMGITNELHEPVFFNGVDRPEVERNIIPSTWNENGVGLHGELAPGLSYKLYGVTGLNAARAPAAGNWIRGLRTRGGTASGAANDRALAETFAGVAALAYDLGVVSVGGSAYYGRSGQGQVVRPAASGTTPADLREIEGDVTMFEAHAQVAWRGVTLRGLGVQGRITDAELINLKHGLTGGNGLGSRVRGAYAEGAFDLMTLVGRGDQLVPFVRYELLKFHDQVPAGTTRNPALDVDLVTAGLSYKPTPTVALKADWSWRKTGAESNAVTRSVNVGAGFVF